MKWPLLFTLTIVFVYLSCTGDTFDPVADCDQAPPTYDNEMKAIIDRNCSYSQCHDGSDPFIPGDYRTYDGMRIHFSGVMEREIVRQDMPPPDAPTELTQEDFDLFICWIQGEFPEN